jgi:hypothetical protein
MPKIVRLAIVAAVVLVGAVWYLHWSRTRALDSGEVHVRQRPVDNARPTAPVTANPPSQSQEIATNGVEDQGRPSDTIVNIPTTDTSGRNPPNRTLISTTGRFQLYRQGDITWRMDTASGQACVLFATQAMWRKTLVYEHGCGAS